MSHQRKSNRKKSSSSPTSSSYASENIEQPSRRMSQPSSSGFSLRKPVYPNVPKRTRQLTSIDDQETIQTESRIDIIPSQRPEGSSSNRTAYTRHTLDLITKYTSPKKTSQESHHHPLSPIQSQISVLSNNQSVYGAKFKRTLSPLDETDQPIHKAQRTQSFDEDDDELSQLIDHRRTKQISSQNSNKSISSQVTNDGESRKPTVRKPTVRKLSTNQQKPSISQPSPERLLIDSEETSWLTNSTQDEIMAHSISTPIIPSPIKLPIDSVHSTMKQNVSFIPICSAKQTLENPMNNSSPCSNHEDGRRFSTTSSNSLFFDTPNSSFSRTTTNNTTSTPQTLMKNDCETQISFPSNIDMINQLIFQMSLTPNNIDYDPIELSKKFFHQCAPLSFNNKYSSMNFLIQKQFLNFGRYEIEILLPSDNNHNSTIYVCDRCLKHFSGSTIAFQRHTAKCLQTQPPGKLVFNQDDVAIFQIGDTEMTMSQCIYIKFLCRIARLFMDRKKSIDDTKLDRFIYYILCRRDPILSESQPAIYRLIGYFSKPLHQQAQQLINNLSCLFIVPSFAQHEEYYQLLIAFSYFLVRSNTSTNVISSSPVRPLDLRTLSAFRTYWCDILFAYINNHCSMKALALNTFARQTAIHPRDILSSLYSHGLIIPHPTDKSSVYLHKNTGRLMASLNFEKRKKYLLLNIDEERKMMIDKQNSNKSHDSGIEEIVLE